MTQNKINRVKRKPIKDHSRQVFNGRVSDLNLQCQCPYHSSHLDRYHGCTDRSVFVHVTNANWCVVFGHDPYGLVLWWRLITVNPFPHTIILQQTTLNIFCQNIENLYNWMDNLWQIVGTLWQKEKLHVLCYFFFCHYVFKKSSAAEAPESVYMRERVNHGFIRLCNKVGRWYSKFYFVITFDGH